MDKNELIKLRDTLKETSESVDELIKVLDRRDKGENVSFEILTAVNKFTNCFMKFENINKKKFKFLKRK